MIRRVLEKFWNKKEKEPDITEQTVFDEIEEMFNSLGDNEIKILLGEDLQEFRDEIGICKRWYNVWIVIPKCMAILR